MAIFVTGASGYIGGAIATALAERGQSVRGLVRTEDKARGVAAAGIVPVLGTLDDAETLAREARAADAVVNAADSDHLGAAEALIDGLAGSGKPLLHTSGSSIVSDTANGEFASARIFYDDEPFEGAPARRQRVAIDRLVRAAAGRGVRSAVLCDTMIYGRSRGLHAESVQVPELVGQARRSGIVRTVGPGRNIWSNVHLDDMVDLYLLALGKAPAGSFYFVENGEESFDRIAAAIARRFGLRGPQAWSVEEASEEWGRARVLYSLGTNCRVRGRRARADLGWVPRHASITEWIEQEA
jgi:nucleoside-diphosphate-sugar epimerase